eukprot:scaffold5017_cov171-Amphora_coffeaeformis.AAC.9
MARDEAVRQRKNRYASRPWNTQSFDRGLKVQYLAGKSPYNRTVVVQQQASLRRWESTILFAGAVHSKICIRGQCDSNMDVLKIEDMWKFLCEVLAWVWYNNMVGRCFCDATFWSQTQYTTVVVEPTSLHHSRSGAHLNTSQ